RILDAARLTNIDAANRRRLIRAIEIASTGKTTELPPPLPMRVLKIGIARPKTMLHRNIDRRVDTRLRQGLIAEVRRLHGSGLSWKRLDDFGLEYRYLSRYLRGQLAKTEAVRQLKSATHDFAKRQLTWWKRDSDINWVNNPAQAIQFTIKHLSLSSRA
ncbi:MAG: tRNA dimethylallyltransferase, partial [Patescibacteria group bacterium]